MEGDAEDTGHVCELTQELVLAASGTRGLGTVGKRAGGEKCQAAKNHLDRQTTEKVFGKRNRA
jgi:hypothetical protein